MSNLNGQTIENYHISELICETTSTQLYRANQILTAEKQGIPVLFLHVKKQINMSFSSSKTISLTDKLSMDYGNALSQIEVLQKAIAKRRPGYTNTGYTRLLNTIQYAVPEYAPDNYPYIVFENVSGGKLLSEFDLVDQDSIPTLFLNIADGLLFAHNHGVAHGALHAQNIMIRPVNMAPKLFGFQINSRLKGCEPDPKEDYKALVMLLYALRKNQKSNEEGMRHLLNNPPNDFAGVPERERVLILDVLNGKQYSTLSEIIAAYEEIYADSGKKSPGSDTIKYPDKGKVLQEPGDIPQSPKPDISIEISKDGKLSKFDRDIAEHALEVKNRIGTQIQSAPGNLHERFKPIESEGGQTRVYPSPEEFRRLCELQVMEDENHTLKDGALLGSGSYATVVYRRRGNIETAEKIYDLRSLLEKKDTKDLEIRLQMMENEYLCQIQNRHDLSLALFYPEYSTPISLISTLTAQVMLFNQLTETGITRIERRRLAENALHSSYLEADWIDTAIRITEDPNPSRSPARQMELLRSIVSFPEFIVLSSEFGLSYLYFMHWFQQTSTRMDFVLDAIYDLFHLLDTFHQSRMIHLDLKPTNLLLVNRDGVIRPVAIDFNTTHRSKHAHMDGTMTFICRPVGSSLYMPKYWLQMPNAFHTGLELSQKVDVYAIGMISCQLLDNIMADSNLLERKRVQWENNSEQPMYLEKLPCSRKMWSDLLYKCLSQTAEDCPLTGQALALAYSFKHQAKTPPQEDNSTEKQMIDLIKKQPNVGNGYYHGRAFAPANSTANRAYPELGEYNNLCGMQFITNNQGLVNKAYAFLPNSRALLYMVRVNISRMQMLYPLANDQPEEMFRFGQILDFTRKLQEGWYTYAVRADLENSTWSSELTGAYEDYKENHRMIPYVKLDMEYGLLYENYLVWLSQKNCTATAKASAMKDIVTALKSLYNSQEDVTLTPDQQQHLSIENLMLVQRDGRFTPAFFGLRSDDLYHAADTIHDLGRIFAYIVCGYPKMEISRQRGETKLTSLINECLTSAPKPPRKGSNKDQLIAYLESLEGKLEKIK